MLTNKDGLIEFDKLSKKFCGCLGFSVDFELTDNSMEYLIEIISDMPYIMDTS